MAGVIVKRAKRGKKLRKVGRNKRKPSFLRWKDRFNRGQGLKHRRVARRAKGN